MSPFDSGTLGLVAFVAAIATAVATVTTLLVGLWQRKVDERRPDWLIGDAHADFSAVFGRCPQVGKPLDRIEQSWLLPIHGVSIRLTLLNASEASGDLLIRLRGTGCSVGTWYRKAKSISPGERIQVTLTVHPDEWNNANLLIFWRTPSLWMPKTLVKSKSLPIRSLAPKPSLHFWETRRTENGGSESLPTERRPAREDLTFSREVDLEALPRWLPMRWFALRRLRDAQWRD